MPSTGIFVIPATTSVSDHLSPAQLIFNNLASKHRHLEQLPTWTLDHRVFREPAPAGDLQGARSAPPTAWLQVLHLSHTPAGQSYAAVSRPAPIDPTGPTSPISPSAPLPTYEPATVLTMPTDAAGEDLAALLTARFGPLWSRRQVVHVANGQAFRGDGFTLRFGEAREARPGQGGAAQLRSTVAEITLAGDPAAGDDTDTAAKVREIWAGLEISGAKEFVDVPGVELGLVGIRQWIEALRPRVA